MISDIFVLNKNFEAVGVLDNYTSLIWTSRYQDVGDFDLEIGASLDLLTTLLIRDYYLWIKGEQDTMIIESVELDTDVDNGNSVIVTGKSLLSILDRRIVWKQTTLDGDLQSEVERLLNENCIKPTDSKRTIPNLIFKKSEDPYILDLNISAQYTGDTILSAVLDICTSCDIGAKISLNDQNQMVFELYHGVDRSYEQEENPYVVFSPEMDNLLSSTFAISNENLKTIALVAGEGEGLDRRTYEVDPYLMEGLDRRELYVDARDISSQLEDQTTMSEEEYNNLLWQRGVENLVESIVTEVHDGEVEETSQYIFGKDFYLGDIVEMEDIYGIQYRSRVTEHIISVSDSENRTYETFTPVNEELGG